MKTRYFRMIGTFSAFTAAGALLLPSGALALSNEVAAEQDVQILTRGPVHEAFAESVSFEPEPGMLVRMAPPEPIEELPPEQQLEGDNVTWIPGYWGWDDDRNDFLWISGIWRNLPPDRQWVPGYWDAVDGGEYQWTSGYWADSETTEVAYIPTPPPRSVDVGPNIASPSEDHTWIPGNWVWGESRYAWRPGYWNPLRPNWTWVPSRYCWTRRGYVYVDGYWDYAVASRGIVFAPVYFNRHVYSDPGYYYTPSIVVSLSVFSSHLFIRPRCGHYYFGDYYAPRYRDSGFYSSFSWHSGQRGYDPIYAYNRWDHRSDRNWERNQQDDFNYFRDNQDARPSHTWAAMRESRTDRFNDGRNRSFATTLDGFVQSPESGQKFRALDKERRTGFVTQGKEMRKFGQERRKSEARPVVAEDVSRKVATREKISRSPVVGRQAEQFAKSEAPPERLEPRGNKLRENRAGKSSAEAQLPGGATEGKNKLPGIGRVNRGESPADLSQAGRGKAPLDRTRELPGKKPDPAVNRKIKPEPEVREKPERQPQVGPERKVKPTPQVRETTPQRQPQVAPERKVKPAPQVRETTPQRQPQVAPERKAKPVPQVRETTPQRQPQVAPERKVKPAPQVREVPKRQPQVAPERKVKPVPQVREMPKREVQRQIQPQREMKPQRQVQPQREVPPQRQVQPQIPKREKDGEKEKKGGPDA